MSLWNGSTFVETVKQGDIRRPVTTVDVTIPSGVTAVKLCVNISGRYAVELKRITIRGVISPATMFNERYAQPYMIQANEAYLSATFLLRHQLKATPTWSSTASPSWTPSR